MQRNTQIQQGTPEWLKAKLSTVGGSEIYDIVLNFTTEEERNKYLKDFLAESSFGSVMQTAIKNLYEITPNNFSEVNRDYGNAMELPMIEWLNHTYSQTVKAEYTRDFVMHEKHPNISCSPDGYIELQNEVYEFATETPITKADGHGLLELKTIRFEDAKQETKMQYLFQCNWNAWVCQFNWYAIVRSYVKDYNLETDFAKGKRVVYAENMQYDKIFEEVECDVTFYKINKPVIKLCIEAVQRYFTKLNEARKLDYSKMWTVFSFSKKSSQFQQEKRLLAQIQDHAIQECFGERQATEEETNMMVERFKNNIQIKELEERNTIIEGHFLNSILDNSSITGLFDMFELKCNKTEKGINFTPTLRNKKLIEYIKNPTPKISYSPAGFGSFTGCETGTCGHAICTQNKYNQEFYD